MKKAVIVGIVLFSFMMQSTVALAFVYDDFSGSTLNLTKWNESTNYFGFTDEHYVNISEGAYHIKQNTEGDRGTFLEPNRQFVAGESFSYEVNYRGGSGNHASQPMFNGIYPPTQIEVCNYHIAGCGVIGYWNDNPDLGAQVGTCKIKYEFFSDRVRMTAIRPDNVTVVNTFTGISEPYNILINTHTGHNGLMHFDYDNVEINSNKLETLKEWTFDTDLQGWLTDPPDMNLPVRYCEWENYSGGGYVGNPPGSVYCASCLTSNPADSICTYPGCSEIHIDVTLPKGAKTLTFETSGSWPMYGINPLYDGGLTFKIKDELDIWHVLYDDCLAIDSSTWLPESVDISQFAGQNVTLRFEQSEKNCGSGQTCNVEVRRIDNVKILGEEIPILPEPPCNCTDLTNKITELNSTVEGLKSRVKTLEDNQGNVPPHTHSISDIIGLQGILDSIQNSLNRVINFLTYLPKGLRQDMVCDYMTAKSMTSLDALGLHCDIIKKACKCKNII